MATVFTRVESRETYPVPERPHYTIKLSKGEVEFYLNGKEMPDDKIGDVIIQLINALNAAEKQIDHIFTFIQNLDYKADPGECEDYLDEYPEDENYRHKYKIEDLKDAILHSMMKKDEKKISYYVNQLSVLEGKAKEVKNG
jgi:hypothetical protein